MEWEEEMREELEKLRTEVEQLRKQPPREPWFEFDWAWFAGCLGIVGYFAMWIVAIITTS